MCSKNGMGEVPWYMEYWWNFAIWLDRVQHGPGCTVKHKSSILAVSHSGISKSKENPS